MRLLGPRGIAVEAAVADRFRRRLVGLAWLAEPPPVGLLIPRCRSVHTIGMRFALDVVFLDWTAPDHRARVLAVRERVGAFRVAALPRAPRRSGAARVAVLELAAGRATETGLVPGTELGIRSAAAG